MGNNQIYIQILNRILQHSIVKNRISLLVSQPDYIEKYAYLEKKYTVGYILNNSVGVLFEDGSCVLGSNAGQYTYYHNNSRESGMGIYENLYSKYILKQDGADKVKKPEKEHNDWLYNLRHKHREEQSSN